MREWDWPFCRILAIFFLFFSMVIFLTVLTRLDAIQASPCNYRITFFGLVIAALLLVERMTSYMIFGGILLLLSTLLVTGFEEHQHARNELATVPAQL